MARRVGLGVLILVVLLVVALAVVVTGVVRQSWPQTSGEIKLNGLGGRVEVIRDARGIPQIYADSTDDLFRAQGFVAAQDRFFEMDFRRHVTAGRLSEMVGSGGLATDKVVRTMGWRSVAEKELSLVSPATRQHLNAYADGVNDYIGRADSPSDMGLEYVVLGQQYPGYTVEKWSAVDSLAWLKAMGWDLISNYGDELTRARLGTTLAPDRLAVLFPDYSVAGHPPILGPEEWAPASAPAPSAIRPALTQRGGTTPAAPSSSATPSPVPLGSVTSAVFESAQAALDSVPALLGRGDGIGSNSWVVAGSKTTTGKPLLANDPHLGTSIPGIWYQTGLHCRTVSAACPFDVSGYTFAGMPGVIIGHNQSMAWGRDQPRARRLGLLPREGHRPDLPARRAAGAARDLHRDHQGGRGQRRPAEDPPDRARPDRLRRHRLGGPGRPERAGPARAAAGHVCGLARLDRPGPQHHRGRDLRDEHGGQLHRVPRRGRQVRGALAEPRVCGHGRPHRVPVTGDGPDPAHIGAQHAARLLAGTGWDSQYDWKGFVPFEQLPWTYDPPEGYIVTANNQVTAATGPQVPFLTSDWDYGWRSSRIEALLKQSDGAGAKISPERMNEIQNDTYNGFAPTLVQLLLQIDLSGDEFAQQAQTLLGDWDFLQPSDKGRSRSRAAYYNAVWMRIVEYTFNDELPQDLQANGGGRYMAAMLTLLKDPTNGWWDDRRTPGLGGDPRRDPPRPWSRPGSTLPSTSARTR